MPIDNEQEEGLVLSIWQAITMVGDVRERSDEIEPSELETVLAEAESLLIAAVSEAAQRPDGPTRQRRGLRFWKAVQDTPSRHVSRGGSTSVIPFPGALISKASSFFGSDESGAPTGTAPGINQAARPPHQDRRGVEAATGLPSFRRSGVPIGRTLRLLLLVALSLLPMIAILAWHERDLRNKREEVIRERVVHRVQQLAAEIGELREGARQLLLAIAQSEEVKTPPAGGLFCASGDPTNGQKVIAFGQQFDDSNGRLAGVIFAGLDLVWLSELLKENGLPPTPSKLIADREGNIIARLPHPEEFVGQNMRRSHERIMDGGEAGWEELTGVDGVTRILGYLPSSLPPRDFFSA